MAKNRKTNKTARNIDMDLVEQLLIEGKLSKREIANKIGCDAGVVYRFASEIKAGQRKQKEVQQQEEPAQLELDLGTTVEDVVAEENDQHDIVRKGGQGIKIPDNIKLSIVEDMIAGGKYSEVSKKYGVSDATVANALKEMGYRYSHKLKKYLPVEEVPAKKKPQGKKKRTTAKRSTKSEIIEPKDWRDLLEEVELEKHLICTTFYGRHPLPTDLAVFGTSELTSDQMFDMQFLEKTAIEFIKDNVEFKNGVADRDMILYPTGNLQAIGAVCRACVLMKVNLTFYHYNAADHSRDNKQVVLDQFKQTTKSRPRTNLDEFMESRAEKLFYFNCSRTDLEKAEKFYVIQHTDNDVESCDRAYFCKSSEDGWKLYANLIEEMSISEDKKQNEGYYLRLVEKTPQNKFFIKTLTKGFAMRTKDQ